jgi:hypothetical protein
MLRAIIEASRLTFRRPARAWLMARMATWVTALSFLVKFYPLPRALRLVSTNTRGKRNEHPARSDELSTAIDAVLGINFLIFKPSCWKRAAVLHRYLALQGAATTIVFGLRREPQGELKGHAWVEYEGQPILERSPPVYKVTYTFPSADSFDVELALMAAARE